MHDDNICRIFVNHKVLVQHKQKHFQIIFLLRSVPAMNNAELFHQRDDDINGDIRSPIRRILRAPRRNKKRAVSSDEDLTAK